MIDIIIPIYRGVEETSNCIYSILESKNNTPFRLILVNDCSPDSKILDLMDQFNSYKNVIVMNNSSNKGFVYSVNTGMKKSSNDVILLNSDTMVSDYCIDELVTVAYLEEKIGTVTSLTNRGTITSVPRFNRDSAMPKKYDINDFSKLIKRTIESMNIKSYARIPTCVGHCVYIKRKLIDEIGYFDMETFGKGYGEEVDFSQRAKKHGWYNVVALKSFVYHVGSISFKKNKQLLIKEHKAIIDKKYFWNRVETRMFILKPNVIKKLCYQLQDKLKE